MGVRPPAGDSVFVVADFACISYVDAQVGRIIKALRATELYDNTVILFMGDHGCKQPRTPWPCVTS
jgi:arylsulfatase A-like enzyme